MAFRPVTTVSHFPRSHELAQDLEVRDTRTLKLFLITCHSDPDGSGEESPLADEQSVRHKGAG